MIWALGVVSMACGAGLEFWAALALGWRRALDLSDAPPDPALPRLVFGGPFRVVRHPQSLGLLLMVIGTTLAVGPARSGAVAVLAGGLVVAMTVRHDRDLARVHGEAYARYRRQVRLLLPLRRPAK
jgi:protein-S-isoprenylcysteine O-methyltransferase Ste14